MGLIEVRSAINRDTNSPVYGNCTLAIGDGSVKVPFENGRAMVEEDIVRRYLINNGGLEFPSLGIWRTAEGTAGAPIAQDATSDLQGGLETRVGPVEPVDAEAAVEQLSPDDKAALIAKLLADPAVAEKAIVAATDPEVVAPDGNAKSETESEKRLRESAEEVERLKAAGELPDDGADDGSSPQAVRVVPAGFEDKTPEGDPRCLAKTSSGSQCKNAAVDADGVGSACAIEAHQKQFSS